MKSANEWADIAYNLCNSGAEEHAVQHARGHYSAVECNGHEIPCKAHVAEAISRAQAEVINACVQAVEGMPVFARMGEDQTPLVTPTAAAGMIRALATLRSVKGAG